MSPFYLEKSLGIDIREESVSLILLGKALGNIDIIGFHFFKIKPLENEDAEIFFLEEINRFLLPHNLASTSVIVSLPRSLVSVQSFELPAPDINVIDAMIGFEVERHFFSKPEDLYFTYHAAKLAENRFHVFMSAIKKETADYYLKLVERLPLKVAVMDVSTLPNLSLVANGQKPGQIMATIDLSSNAYEISLVRNGNIEISRNILINNSALKNSFFIDDLPPENYAELSEEWAREIVKEIITTLSCCDRISKDENIEQIHILGGGHFADALAGQIGFQSDVPTAKAIPPFKAITRPEDYKPAYFTTAVGLALRELKPGPVETNLLPATIRPKKKKINFRITFALFLGLLVLLTGYIFAEIYYKKSTFASLENQLNELKRQVAPLEKIDQSYESMGKFLNAVTAIRKLSPPKLPLLEELTKLIPKDTWLTDVSIVNDKVEIRGLSATASALIHILENSPRFKDTGFNGSIVKTPEGERFTIRFNLKADK
jgi:Tfp pilus assembly PilM family ATPase/Tfp pilus assembly protein PilN